MSKIDNRFPILGTKEDLERYAKLGLPSSVPFALIGSRAQRCMTNHFQTPQRLAERGGLSPGEMTAIIEDRPWHKMTEEDSISRLLIHLAFHEEKTR